MKKLFIMALMGTLGFAGLQAQAGVTVLGWPGGPEETALRAAVEVYNGKENVGADDKVDLLFFSRDGYFDKLAADLAAQTDAFDANLIATYSIGRYAPFMEPIDLGAEASDVFGDAVLRTMQYEGAQYGVPTDLSLHFMYYREDLIESLLKDSDAKATYSQIAEKYLGKAMSPKAPDEWNWEDWAATALYFTKSVNRNSPTRYGTTLQMKNLLFNMMVFQSLPRAYGGDWRDGNRNITVASEAYRQGLQMYKMLLDAGATPSGSLSYEYAEANAAFGSGQVATMLQWNAAATDLLDPEKNPVVANVTATIAPPSGPEGRFTHVHGLGLGLNKAGKNKTGARAFLQWLATPEAIGIYALAGGTPGLTGPALKAVKDARPDLVPLGCFALQYGFVMDGATSASALAIYELQAKAFTGYWGDVQTLDDALAEVEAGMADLLN